MFLARFCCCLRLGTGKTAEDRVEDISGAPQNDSNVETLGDTGAIVDDSESSRRDGETLSTPTQRLRSIMDGFTPPSDEYDGMSREEQRNAIKGWVDHIINPLIQPAQLIEFDTKPSTTLDYNVVVDI
mmetsp:Transcript_10202/g.23881  ORF Transcript_10202/g.23881 Transcript_10202/m.23881 type:complete len:128 (-) Transcript_10202:1562-1945(-)